MVFGKVPAHGITTLVTIYTIKVSLIVQLAPISITFNLVNI